ILAAFLCFALFAGFGLLATLFSGGAAAYFVGQLGLEYHYQSLSRGLIDSRNVVYLLSVTAVALLATRLVLGSRQW
nr:gliding motility-associated ABC transporter permease subunit GldF [Cytophagales bacterium]